MEASIQALTSETQSAYQVSAHAILRWRWLVFILGFFATLATEALDGPLVLDLKFLEEFILHGVLVPGVFWLLLTGLARSLMQRDRIASDLERYKSFTQKLAQHQEWSDLTRFVVQFMTQQLPVERASLLLYDHSNARLELAADWDSATGSNEPEAGLAPVGQLCYTCLFSRLRHAQKCQYAPGSPDPELLDGLCVPLIYRNLIVGSLRLKCPPDVTLNTEQVEFIQGLTPEIGRALVFSVSYPKQIEEIQATAQMDERREIAQFLHNSLAQQLGYLHLSLDRLASDSTLDQPASTREELERMRDVAGDAYEHIRNLLSLLRADEPQELIQTIETYLETMGRRFNLAVDFTTEGTPRALSPRVAQHVFGMLQEGLTNTHRHAQARRVTIHLAWLGQELRMRIVDDGVGFDPAQSPQTGHYGLKMMRERIQDLGGALSIHSQPQAGTALEFQIPV